MKSCGSTPSLTFGAPLLLGAVALQLFFVGYATWHFLYVGHLPAPFFYDARDTFMDYFNTNYWAFKNGRFEDWLSIYPIFVFQFAQWVSSASCNWGDSFYSRVCDLLSIWPLFACYMVGVAACVRIYSRVIGCSWRHNPLKCGLLVLFLSLSMPGLFALERGNYIVLAFACLSLSSLLGLGWMSAIFMALAINIKQYLLVLLVVPFLKQHYVFIVKVFLGCVVINLLGLIQVDELHYELIFSNMTNFSGGSAQPVLVKIWFPTSLAGWNDLVRFVSAGKQFLSSGVGDVMEGVFIGVRIFQVALFGAIFWMMCLAKDQLDYDYCVFAILMILMAAVGSLGGYALLLALPYWPSALRRSDMRWLLLVFVLLTVPIDITVPPAFHVPGMKNIYGEVVSPDVFLTTGAYLRPILVMAAVCYVFRDLFKMTLMRSKGV